MCLESKAAGGLGRIGSDMIGDVFYLPLLLLVFTDKLPITYHRTTSPPPHSSPHHLSTPPSATNLPPLTSTPPSPPTDLTYPNSPPYRLPSPHARPAPHLLPSPPTPTPPQCAHAPPLTAHRSSESHRCAAVCCGVVQCGAVRCDVGIGAVEMRREERPGTEGGRGKLIRLQSTGGRGLGRCVMGCDVPNAGCC